VAEVRLGQHSTLFPAGFVADVMALPALERFCAEALSTLCAQRGLSIPLLQPLRDFENFKSDADIKRAVDGAERWFSLMPHFRTDLLLVCSNLVPGATPLQGAALEEYLRWQVRAFTALSLCAERYGVRVGYEPLAWGTVVDRWELVWRVVKQVDRPNVGVILDSFNQMWVHTLLPLE
jgi:4-hydroxyphenylpyruvate dioxygenase